MASNEEEVDRPNFPEDQRPEIWRPPAPETVIWRYMSLARFLSLVLPDANGSGQLYFPRADHLGDPFEGSIPSTIAERRLREGWQEDLIEQDRMNHEGARKWSAVSCWHINDAESAALWELYSRGEGAVAIQSTYGRLRHSLTDANMPIGIGTVRYIDYETMEFEAGYIQHRATALLHKRLSFAHEKELRAIIGFTPPKLPGNIGDVALKPGDPGRLITPEEFFHQDPPFAGVSVPIDVERLIGSVRLAPTQPSWIATAVEGTCRQLGYKFEISQSDLDSDPLF